MKDKTNKYIKEIMKDVKLESPSENFTSKLMQKIRLEEKPVYIEKKSFFKKYKFMFIFSLTFVGIFLMVFFFTDGQSTVISENLNLNPSEYSFFDKFRELFSFNFNLSVTYIIIIIAPVLLFWLDAVIPKINKKYVESTDY